MWVCAAPLRSSPLGLRSAVAIHGSGHKDYEVIVFIDSSTYCSFFLFLIRDGRFCTTREGYESSGVGKASIVSRH